MSLQRRYRGHRSVARVAALICLGAVPGAYADSAWDGMPGSPVWGNFQFGLAAVQSANEGMDGVHTINEYWKLEAGMRVTGQWLVGVGTQHVALAGPRKLAQAYGTVIFIPERSHWLYQAGLGPARYSLADDFQLDEKHKGLTLNLGVGRDWSPGIDDIHFGTRITYEYSRLDAASDGSPSFDHSRLTVGFSMSFY